MLIGEVADRLDVPRHTIRFYEKQGLLPEPQRQGNGYRDYDPAVVDRVTFIRNSQAAGLTLSEIMSVLSLRDAGEAPCTHVSSLLEHKLDGVQERLKDLAALEAELKQLIHEAQDRDPANCTEAEICTIIPGAQR
ncbi:heavy metal-responsive transcriptional regulator [Salinibacterium sp. UTAS2018]|uniref:heavy metal-responsive transcriptional regulator n=1 Tax=Salinibacterium sp. UTAS2018 TaxID=2508880 RepID=UPI0010096402|nr:heavy metal-responsive transcriptional regulator [Salinibacterium sp. UTAS2018]QAV69730.1 heavy metal-responsive transcriptional regulator [Salinibacterium sp. UTAS2018]